MLFIYYRPIITVCELRCGLLQECWRIYVFICFDNQIKLEVVKDHIRKRPPGIFPGIVVPHSGTGGTKLAVKAYVLVEVETGTAVAVATRLSEMARNGYSGKLSDIEIVTGQYDVVVKVTHDDLESVGNVVTDGIQKLAGVQRTTTCLFLRQRGVS